MPGIALHDAKRSLEQVILRGGDKITPLHCAWLRLNVKRLLEEDSVETQCDAISVWRRFSLSNCFNKTLFKKKEKKVMLLVFGLC